MPLCAQESIFWAKFDQILAQNPNFYMRKQKFWYPRYKKKHLGTLSALFFGRAWDQMGQKWQYLAQNDHMMERDIHRVHQESESMIEDLKAEKQKYRVC